MWKHLIVMSVVDEKADLDNIGVSIFKIRILHCSKRNVYHAFEIDKQKGCNLSL